MSDPALAALLADGRAQARRRAAARRWARGWEAAAPLAALRRGLAAIAGRDDDAAAAVLDLAAPLLADLGWAERGIAGLTRCARADPMFEPPLRGFRGSGEPGLVLVDQPLLRIAALRVPAATLAARSAATHGPGMIGFSGAPSLLRVVHAGGAVLDLWDAEPAGHDFTLADAPPCRRAGRLPLADGMLVRLDGARRAWSFAGAVGDVVLVHAAARCGGAPYQVEYDAADGRARAASAADGAVSRQQLLAGMLARMGRRDALPVLAELAADAPFALRWAAAQAAWALDPAAAAPLLRRMATADPHPEIRAAAWTALVPA